MAGRTSRGKSAGSERKGAPDGDQGSQPQEARQARSLRLSRTRRLATSALLQELALRPEFLEGIQLGELLTPEPLHSHGQWVVRSEDLLSFHLQLTNLHAQLSQEDADRPAVLAVTGPGAAYITLHFAPQHIAEQVFFAASKIPNGTGRPRRPANGPAAASTSPTPLEPLAPPPIASRIAYPSRLVFRFEETTTTRRRLLAGALHAGRHP